MSGACSGGGSPTGPSQPSIPLPQVTIQVSPNPLQASPKAASGTGGTFEFPVTLTFRENAGASGQITHLTGTVIRQPGNQTTALDRAVSLPFSASGSVSDSSTFQFDVSLGVESISWHVSVSGTDSQGRAFTASSADVTVNPPAMAPPPLPTPPVGRIELWGGANYNVFLGCFSCNEFAGDSVFNQFGPFGGRFSPTSVWNRFSDYGSPFSPTSACNEFAANPPRIVDTAARTYTELTLNTFRPFGNRTPAVLNLLKNQICAD